MKKILLTTFILLHAFSFLQASETLEADGNDLHKYCFEPSSLKGVLASVLCQPEHLWERNGARMTPFHVVLEGIKQNRQKVELEKRRALRGSLVLLLQHVKQHKLDLVNVTDRYKQSVVHTAFNKDSVPEMAYLLLHFPHHANQIDDTPLTKELMEKIQTHKKFIAQQNERKKRNQSAPGNPFKRAQSNPVFFRCFGCPSTTPSTARFITISTSPCV
jgi:hypothetical protein